MAQGTIGFRTGTPKLKTLKGFTWESALNLVREFLPDYIRKKEEINKDKLLTDRDIEYASVGKGEAVAQPMGSLMAKCGIQVVQDEAFYVEPKTEDKE